jgi:antitoxin component YwqK of YwqJK toxin-antitoxin module
MKTLLPVLIAVLSLSGCSGRVMKELMFENGNVRARWYEKPAATEKAAKDGKYESWYENGQKSEEGEYVDGKMHGRWVAWYQNGQKEEEGEYVNGKRHGIWTFWDEDGNKENERIYFNGRWTE